MGQDSTRRIVSSTPGHGGGSRMALKVLVVLAGAFTAFVMVRLLDPTGSDARLETACASVLNVLNPDGSTFARQASNVSGNAVRMLYTVKPPSGEARRVVVQCGFATSTTVSGVPQLTGVAVNDRELGPARLSFLNRFWLPSEEAAIALPAGKPTQPAQTGTARPSEPG